MKWKKKGIIFKPDGNFGWMNSHAQVPVVLVLKDRLRVFFSTRPKPTLSLTTFIDLDKTNPKKIINIHDKPILPLGKAGMFDEHGIMANHVFEDNGIIKLFYVGWSRRCSIPYSNWMGLAISEDGGTSFRKIYQGPILDRTPHEVYSATGLICERHNGKWFGWYATGVGWLKVNGRYEHTYELRSCFSDNHLEWVRPNQPIFPAKLPHESSTRPTVVHFNNKWHMWFCYRGTQDFRDGNDSYRIGYAWSDNLLNWYRDDNNVGIDTSKDGWDSRMVAYPCVVKVDNKMVMFYNGNYFGQGGIGYAELEE